MFDPEVLEPDEVGFFEDVLKVVTPVVNDTVRAGQDAAAVNTAQLVEQLVRSSHFKRVLTEVEGAAQKAVTKEVGKNALALVGIAGAAGIVGGALFKGRSALLVAGVLAGVGIVTIMRQR